MEYPGIDTAQLAKKIRVSPAEVEHMLDALRGAGVVVNDKIEPYLTHLLTAMVRYSRGMPEAGSTEARAIDAPPDWKMYSHNVFEQYRREQRRILGLFGLASALDYDEEDNAPVCELLQRADRAQTPVGHALDLCYYGDDGGYIEAWGGVNDDAPLYQLAELSARMAAAEGISQEDAVDFILTDHEIVLPWIDARIDRSSLGDRMRVVLSIATTDIHPDEVRDAYARVIQVDLPKLKDRLRTGPQTGDSKLDALARKLGAEIEDAQARLMPELKTMPTYTRSRTTARMAAMVLFVDAWKRERQILGPMPSGEWPKVSAAFNESFRDTHKPFEASNMRKQYRNQKAKLSGGSS